MKCGSSKHVEVKPIINKSNGQINFSMPKKKIDKDILDKLNSGNKIKLFFED